MYDFTYVYFVVAALEVTNLLYENIKKGFKKSVIENEHKDANKQVIRLTNVTVCVSV